MILRYFSRLVKEKQTGDPAGPEPEGRRGRRPVPSGPWVGVDLDGTLAFSDIYATPFGIGRPVPAMLDRVRQMLARGVRVKIFTARAGDPAQIPLIRNWLRENGLPDLEITNVKDYEMQCLYDDRAVRVEQNTGRIISDSP